MEFVLIKNIALAHVRPKSREKEKSRELIVLTKYVKNVEKNLQLKLLVIIEFTVMIVFQMETINQKLAQK